GKDKNTPAAVIQEGTTARQKVALGTLATIVEDAAKAGIQTPAITVVGDVATLRERIDWFGKEPLSGKRVLLTATPKMAQEQAEVLEAEGAETIRFSLIYTQPLLSEEIARAVARLSDYSWLVFTSSNGVDIFFDYLLQCGKDLRSLAGIKIAVIGEGTRCALAARGLQADFVPESFSSKALAKEWIPTLTKDDRVLLLRAEEASQELNRALDAASIPYTADALYRTAVDTRKEEELRRLLQDVDYVTLCSASAARAFASMTQGLEYRAQVVCIGPVTEKAARAEGIPVGQSAVVYDAEGIRDVLLYEVR
ncbi:MAG: uroporphyrinogen-III synthase, partial [Lachnospiraceae bacterium]|nr:uroporphyrinogen-III synthase [Lachnospiraceae bacterium]